MLFNNSITADRILQCDTPYEAKKLGYQVQGMDNRKWLEKGYTIYLEGMKAKLTQNPELMNMLRTTKPKLLAEATTDRNWGTGIHLRSPDAYNPIQ